MRGAAGAASRGQRVLLCRRLLHRWKPRRGRSCHIVQRHPTARSERGSRSGGKCATGDEVFVAPTGAVSPPPLSARATQRAFAESPPAPPSPAAARPILPPSPAHAGGDDLCGRSQWLVGQPWGSTPTRRPSPADGVVAAAGPVVAASHARTETEAASAPPQNLSAATTTPPRYPLGKGRGREGGRRRQPHRLCGEGERLAVLRRDPIDDTPICRSSGGGGGASRSGGHRRDGDGGGDGGGGGSARRPNVPMPTALTATTASARAAATAASMAEAAPPPPRERGQWRRPQVPPPRLPPPPLLPHR